VDGQGEKDCAMTPYPVPTLGPDARLNQRGNIWSDLRATAAHRRAASHEELNRRAPTNYFLAVVV
jgi:hypothetical protein